MTQERLTREKVFLEVRSSSSISEFRVIWELLISWTIIFVPTLCNLNLIFCRRNKSTRNLHHSSHDFIARFCFPCKHPPLHSRSWLVASLLIWVNTVHTWFYPLCKQMQTSRILTNLKWASAVIAAILAQSVIFPSLSNTCKSTFTDQT